MNPQTVSTAFKTAYTAWAVANHAQVDDFVADTPKPPCVAFYPETVPYDITAPCRWIAWCSTGTIEEQGAQARLLGWLAETGATSLIQVIDQNHSLSGAVSSVIPLEVRGYGVSPVQQGRPRFLQAQLVFDVLR